MANNSKIQKKLPKRTANKARQERCARAWGRSQKRKEARRKAQEAAHARNVEQGFTAWEKACEARRLTRHPGL